MIRIDSDVVEKSKELGLNISKVCENCLKIAIRQMQGFYMKNYNIGDLETDNHLINWCGEWDSNPRRPTPRGPEPRTLDQTWLPPHNKPHQYSTK